MQVRILPFGVLKDWLGAAPSTVELREGASVADLLERLSAGRPAPWLRGIAVSVNAEYSTAARVLRDGDEVGLLPPVSGGAPRTANVSGESQGEPAAFTALTREPIATNKLVAALKHGEDGALVVFDGIVRNHSRGRQTLYLDYEAYEELAVKQMNELAVQARQRFALRDTLIVHRLGRLEIGETSVLIAVASAHRAAAFEACRWLIDTLKTTVPIWKKETFVDGAVWAPGEPFPAPMAVNPPEAPHDA
jgi:molybdopterin synthase catalytic subunit